jgi:hypothetical protein
MGLCWSDTQPLPAQQRVYYPQKQIIVSPQIPPLQLPPPAYPPQQYTQQPQYVVYPYPHAYAQQQPQNRIGTAEAVIGGMILGSVLEDMMDPE